MVPRGCRWYNVRGSDLPALLISSPLPPRLMAEEDTTKKKRSPGRPPKNQSEGDTASSGESQEAPKPAKAKKSNEDVLEELDKRGFSSKDEAFAYIHRYDKAINALKAEEQKLEEEKDKIRKAWAALTGREKVTIEKANQILEDKEQMSQMLIQIKRQKSEIAALSSS